ncbi:unnamed protein product [Symbiodinium microadriaticum]|nr:unnamed protein product [Symbiodinium microadriaticum]
MLAKFFVRGDVSDSGFLQSFVTWTRQCWPVTGEPCPQQCRDRGQQITCCS